MLGDGIPLHSIHPHPPFHTSKIKDEKNRECGGECGELEGVPSPSTGTHIWLSKVNSSSRLPKHIKMLYLVIHASMKVKALQKKNTQPALPLTSASFQPANMRSMNSMTNFYMTCCTAFKWKKTIVLFVLK